jgi:hypothetical protein
MLIEQTNWTDYLVELSRYAEGYSTSIEVLSTELGDQTEARSVPLRELAYDPHEGIAVSVGGTTAEHPVVLRHVIARPTRLEVTDEPGIPTALMIDAEDGTRTLIRLDGSTASPRLTADDGETAR